MANKDILTPDICVIGAGSGGLSVAAGAAQMGASVVLVEKSKMGGDCLNTGCVPSKALLAAAHAAQNFRTSDKFGVASSEPQIDFAKVNDHVKSVIASIAPNDSVERFEGFGVTVIQDAAKFTSPKDVIAGGKIIRARRFVIATGSSAAVPPIKGLDSVDVLTNENVFDLRHAPKHLLVIGGGPIGIEMAQAHRRLGSQVTVMQRSSIMTKDDRDLVAVVRKRLIDEGVTLQEGIKIISVAKDGKDITVLIEKDGKEEIIIGSHLLVAAGRKANVDGLDLDKAGIKYSPCGIEVDAGLKSSNKKVYAIGDVAGGFQFTHVAGYHAGVVIKSALFRLPAKADHSAVPWVTYTDPELANVGLNEPMARAAHGDNIEILRWSFEENDRAQGEKETDGLVKVILDPNGRILGAGIVGPHAGELIGPWVLAVSQKMKIGAMAMIIAPYPTLGEVSKRVAGSYYTPKLFSERTRKMVKFLSKFG